MTYQIQSTFDENFKIIPNLNPSVFTVTSSYTDVADSQIDYKPSPSASFIIYQFSCYIASSEDNSASNVEINSFFKLQYSDDNGETYQDWGDNTVCYIGSVATEVEQRSTVDLKWALNGSGWTNTKRLRLQVKMDSGASTVLNQLETFFDSSGELSSTNSYNTSVSCYSID